LADDWGRGKGGCSILILSREFNSIPHALLEWKCEGPAWTTTGKIRRSQVVVLRPAFSKPELDDFCPWLC
jgi:hypothetical protein